MVFIGGALIFAYLSTQEYRHIVRIVGNDIHGDRNMLIGLTQIRGIGYAFASALLDSLKIDPHNNIGFLSDDQVKSIENIIKNPESAKFPSWFLNRRKDLPTGKDMHLITSDIEFSVRTDIEREKTANSWRGFRHTFGLKVRGQRTRTTGRKGGAVGVQKGGKVLPAGAVVPGVTAEGAVPAEGAASATGTAPAAATDKKGVLTDKKGAPTDKKTAAPADKKDAGAAKKETPKKDAGKK